MIDLGVILGPGQNAESLKKQKDFLLKFVKNYNFERNELLLEVVKNAENPMMLAQLYSIFGAKSKKYFTDTLATYAYNPNAGSNLETAIKIAGENLVTKAAGRERAKKVLLIFVDKKVTGDLAKVTETIENLQEDGVKVIVVLTGPAIEKSSFDDVGAQNIYVPRPYSLIVLMDKIIDAIGTGICLRSTNILLSALSICHF